MVHCIFCDRSTDAKSIEHIVPESMGNTHYVMPKGTVCDDCNNRCSAFEQTALGHTVLSVERARYAIKTKQGKVSKGNIKGLSIEGDASFTEQRINVKGLTPDFITPSPDRPGEFHLYVPTFDKSAIPTTKLMLKIGLESLFKSRKVIYNKYDLAQAKEYLLAKNNIDWPILTDKTKFEGFSSIPQFSDKHKFKFLRCALDFLEIDCNTLLFRMKYGGIYMVVNLVDRNLGWVLSQTDLNIDQSLYPDHYRNKIRRLAAKEK